jgi:hypothetical protein
MCSLHLCSSLCGEGSQALLQSVLLLSGFDNLELATLDVVDDTVQLQVALGHGVNDGGVHSQSVETAQNIVLTESVGLLSLGTHLLQLFCVFHSQLAHGLQPNVKQAESGVSEGGIDTTTASVAADENVFDLEVSNGELNDGKRVDVGGCDDVGNVAVDKDLTRLQAQDGGLGDARVGASDPENLGGLALCRLWEEVGVGLLHAGAPLLNALGEGVGKAACGEKWSALWLVGVVVSCGQWYGSHRRSRSASLDTASVVMFGRSDWV